MAARMVLDQRLELPIVAVQHSWTAISLAVHREHSLIINLNMTRSHKLNDRDHVALADGTASAEEHLPRYFAKSGHVDSDPKKVKKEGGGKGNWGRSGEEMQDYGYKFTNSRRRSNSSSQAIGDFKTKFEGIENDPVFEEELHGAEHVPEEDDNISLEKGDSVDSTSSASLEEEEHTKKL